MPDGKPYPRITIVTPSFNQGEFLEQTILSVINQGYPNLEYIIMDGGSTDNSVEIIKKYEQHLSFWSSEKDDGQVDAINKGLERATGEWFNWLNSDDILLPGALMSLIRTASFKPQAEWIVGTRLLIAADGTPLECEEWWRTNPMVVGFAFPNFPQDATFIKTATMRKPENYMNPAIRNVFDSLLHWHLMKQTPPLLCTVCLSAMRIHPAQKTAQVQTLKHETETWLIPQVKHLPLAGRLWVKLLRTRFLTRIGFGLLGGGVVAGLTQASREMQAVAFDQHKFEWKLIPARRAVRYWS